jgi:hypothetical protein
MNLVEPVNETSQWKYGPQISEEMKKALQHEWENGIRALGETRVAVEPKLYCAIQTPACH